LAPPDLFLVGSIGEVPLFAVIVNIILDDPLLNNIRMAVEVIQIDFVQVEV